MKILAVASIGGHWIQLLRLKPLFKDQEVEYVSTNSSFNSTVDGSRFHTIADGNRWNKIGLIKCFFEVLIVIIRSKPNVIISTGAAPGLMALLIGRILGIKTIWIDSIANCNQVSMSGKIVSLFANKTYTQWQHLATEKIKYKGNVIN